MFAFAQGEREDLLTVLAHSARLFVCLCRHSQHKIPTYHLNPRLLVFTARTSTTRYPPKWPNRDRLKSSAPCVTIRVFMLATAVAQSATARSCAKRPTGHCTSCSANPSKTSPTISAPSRTPIAYTSAPSTFKSMAILRSSSGCATLGPTNPTARY